MSELLGPASTDATPCIIARVVIAVAHLAQPHWCPVRLSELGTRCRRGQSEPFILLAALVYSPMAQHYWWRVVSVPRRALHVGKSGAKIAIMECTPADDLEEKMAARVWLDVHMLALCPGKERTLAQWHKLFAAAGFKLTGITETRSPMKVIEATGI